MIVVSQWKKCQSYRKRRVGSNLRDWFETIIIIIIIMQRLTRHVSVVRMTNLRRKTSV